MGMALDENLPVLLERAAGPHPGSGDEADVRRRARRYVRRRRAAVGAAVAALVVPGMFVAGWFRADDGPEVVASNLGEGIQPGDLLFERSLPDGATLRVTATENLNEIAVAWPGSPDRVILPLIDGAVSSKSTGDEWTVLALHPCPGDEAAHLRAFQTANPALVDEMGVINGLAVVIVPPLVPPSYAPLPTTTEVTVETRDSDGNLISSVRQMADLVASDEEGRRDEVADSASASQPPDIVGTDALPSACEDGR
jgi:hypothetical protein